MLKIDLTKKYALAVSGGVDSMVMLRMFCELSPRPDFYVVTVNHNIRRAAADDCEFVKDSCRKLGVECKVFSVDVPSYAEEKRISEETAARILRYEVLDKLDCDFVCLAHHADDNAETVLMHVIRGSGLNGARGMKETNGRYFRPLLNFTREYIEKYAEEHGVTYVSDETNADTRYKRNFIRRKIMPLLKEIQPNVTESILRFAENAAFDDDYLNSLADISSVEFSSQKAVIPAELLKKEKPVSARIVKKVFLRLGVYKDIEKINVQDVLKLAENVGGKSVSLPFGYIAYNDYGKITIEKTPQKETEYFEIPFCIGKTKTPLGIADVTKEYADNALRIDVKKIPQNAVFRPKKTGDAFTKFGGGSKPLKEFLIDKKIPARKRKELLTVSSERETLVVLGVEISEKVKVEKDSDTYYIRLIKEENTDAHKQ